METVYLDKNILTNIGDAIRERAQTDEYFYPKDMGNAILSLPDHSQVTVTENSLLKGYTAYNSSGELITGNAVPRNYRYIKLIMTELQGGETVQISEIEFLNEEGEKFIFPSSTIVTATIEASSGSASNPNLEVPQYLIDNSFETKFCSQKWVEDSYILIDLGENNYIDVNHYSIWKWYTANDTADYPQRNLKNFSLLGSYSGNGYEVLDSVTNLPSVAENYALAYTGSLK